MKLIELTHGYCAKVDDEDYEELSKHKWKASVDRRPDGSIRQVYAFRTKNGKGLYMHAAIMGTHTGLETDHWPDHDGCNNQRNNLLIVTTAENQATARIRRDNTSGYIGVTWNKEKRKWRVKLRIDGIQRLLGSFDCKHKAAVVYNEAKLIKCGERCTLNIIPDKYK